MKYSFTCPCQKVIPVAAAAAGSEIVCGCGSLTQVPRLSELRTMSGEGAYEAGTIDTIQRMLDEGKLPWGETCALSGLPTADSIEVYVECEKLHFREDPGRWFFLPAILLLGWLAVFLKFAVKESDPQGRETRVRTPLRVAREQQAALSKCGQRKLRRLLGQVPIYARLLHDYPGGRIVVGCLPDDRGLKLDPNFAG